MDTSTIRSENGWEAIGVQPRDLAIAGIFMLVGSFLAVLLPLSWLWTVLGVAAGGAYLAFATGPNRRGRPIPPGGAPGQSPDR